MRWQNVSRPIVIDRDPLPLFDPEGKEDILQLSFQRWQASEKLSALLSVCFVKSLSGFDK